MLVWIKFKYMEKKKPMPTMLILQVRKMKNMRHRMMKIFTSMTMKMTSIGMMLSLMLTSLWNNCIKKLRKRKEKKRNIESKKKKKAGGVQSSGLSEDEGLDSNELEDLPPEGDKEYKTFPVYNELKDMSAYGWEVRTLFATREEFKDAVTTYVVHSGRNVSLLNQPSREKATHIQTKDQT
nr:uncharacterized protein LOC112784211 [Arachis hypogaea]